MLLLVPSAPLSPHTRQRNTGARGRGTWLRFQWGLETESSSLSELWETEEAGAWVSAGSHFLFSTPSAIHWTSW